MLPSAVQSPYFSLIIQWQQRGILLAGVEGGVSLSFTHLSRLWEMGDVLSAAKGV